MAKSLIINCLRRQCTDGTIEELPLSKGVNLIVGPPNSGKSVWLRMLDYLLGDTDPPEDAFTAKLAEKYVSVSADVEIDSDTMVLERRWKESGSRTKIFINGQSVDASSEFSDSILEILEIPILHFPKGNPYSERAWVRLSWRILMRHIYRRERFWGDIADKQPESEQHAALVQFLGLAEQLFPPEWEQLIQIRKDLIKLQARKEQFQEIVDRISQDLSSKENEIQYLNPQSLAARIEVLEERVKQLIEQREVVIQKTVSMETVDESRATQLSSQRAELISKLTENLTQKDMVSKRFGEVNILVKEIQNELKRLERVSITGELLADLKITHCPACDQELDKEPTHQTKCFLCNRDIEPEASKSRLDFEIEQLRQEARELGELRNTLEDELSQCNRDGAKLREVIDIVERNLKPIQSKLAAFVSTEIGILDTERGSIEEQIRQFERFKSVLTQREILTFEIDELSGKASLLEARLNEIQAGISFANASNTIEDAMHHFFDILNKQITRYNISEQFKWTQGRVSLDLRERSFSFKIKDRRWSGQVGATSIVHFLLSYHYSLLNLSTIENMNYPGLTIIDFLPELLDAKTIGDKANYLVEPFIELCKRAKQPLQVIIAGRSFQNLEGCERIEFTHVWE